MTDKGNKHEQESADNWSWNTVFVQKLNLAFDEKANQQKYSRHSNCHNAISFNGKYGIDNFERHMKTSFLGNKQLAYFSRAFVAKPMRSQVKRAAV
jgi:hypothetical protein